MIENPHNSSPLSDDAATDTAAGRGPAIAAVAIGAGRQRARRTTAADSRPPDDGSRSGRGGRARLRAGEIDARRAAGRRARRRGSRSRGPRGPIEETPVVDEPPQDGLVHPQGAKQPRGLDSREPAAARQGGRAGQATSAKIIVPTEMVSEFKGGKKRVVKRKLYPGYLVVHMEINDDTWFLVRETPGIGDFTGAAGKPTPDAAARSRQDRRQAGREDRRSAEAEDRLQRRATA